MLKSNTNFSSGDHPNDQNVNISQLRKHQNSYFKEVNKTPNPLPIDQNLGKFMDSFSRTKQPSIKMMQFGFE